MSDSSYQDAVHKLRASISPVTDDGELTRQRIQKSLQARQQRRRRQSALLIAACLTASSALAFYLGAPRSDAPPPPSATASPSLTTQVLPAPSQHPSSPGAKDVPPAPSLERIEHSSAEPTRKAKPARRDTRPPSPHNSATAPDGHNSPIEVASRHNAVSDEQRQALYMTAHRLHFRGAPQVALAAWDAYLATEPTGPLAVEARYNRAVVLARLGQRVAARAALLPFANGTYGTFRKADAQLLLSQLE